MQTLQTHGRDFQTVETWQVDLSICTLLLPLTRRDLPYVTIMLVDVVRAGYSPRFLILSITHERETCGHDGSGVSRTKIANKRLRIYRVG